MIEKIFDLLFIVNDFELNLHSETLRKQLQINQIFNSR